MATITDIREGLAANLAALTGFQVSAYVLANPTPPTIQVLPGDITYDQAMGRGFDWVQMLIQAMVAVSSDVGSQKRLDRLLAPTGPASLKTVVEADKTLGGLVDDLRVTEATGYRAATAEGRGPVLLCEWTVTVLASN